MQKYQLYLLDFVINRFFMKLFKTSNIRIVQLCQLRTVPFELPTTCSSSKTIFREVFRLRINAYYAPPP